MLFDVIGKRFFAYFATLGGGLLAARVVPDGVQLEHFYSFATVLYGTYVAGQTATDSVAFLKGIKTLVRGTGV